MERQSRKRPLWLMVIFFLLVLIVGWSLFIPALEANRNETIVAYDMQVSMIAPTETKVSIIQIATPVATLVATSVPTLSPTNIPEIISPTPELALTAEETEEGRIAHLSDSVNAPMNDAAKGNTPSRITAESYDDLPLPSDTNLNSALFDNNIVMTIDDCYNNQYVREMFELLKANGITATFFPNTSVLPFDEETKTLWKDIYQAGFEIGYHTIYHAAYLSYGVLEQDFWAFTQYMRELLDDDSFSIKLVRAPYGEWYDAWYRFTEDNHLMSVRWNVLTDHSPDLASQRLQEGISPIVLLHSTAFDVDWLKNNLDQLIAIADQYNGIVGSVYDCLHRELAFSGLQIPAGEDINTRASDIF